MTGSTRAFRIWVRYCDSSAGFLSRMTKTVRTKKTASDAVPVQNRRRIVHHVEGLASRSPEGPLLSPILSRSWRLKNSSLVSAETASSRLRRTPTFLASAFSASAAALSGNDASNSDNSRPLSFPSSHAVQLSSNVFINVSQLILQFLARIKQARHHRAYRATECFRDFMILHLFNLLHQDDGTLLWRELFNRLVYPRTNFTPFHDLVRQSF